MLHFGVNGGFHEQMSTPKTTLVRWETVESAVKNLRWISDRQRPFFLGWIRKFVLANASTELGPDKACEAFLESLRAEEKYADWQVFQAEKALRWYRQQFLGERCCDPGNAAGELG